MKKLLTLVFAFSFALLLTGCIDQKVELVVEPEEVVVNPITEVTEDVEDTNEETMDIKVYFPSEKDNENMMDCRKTDWVTRTIPKTTAVAKAALEQLFIGPTEEEITGGIVKFQWLTQDNYTNALKRVFVKGDTVYLDWVNFDKIVALHNTSSSCGASAFMAPIEDTLLQFPNIKKVANAFEGSPEAFYNFMQSSCEGRDICDPTPFQ